MAVIDVIPAGQRINITVIVIQVKPGGRNYIHAFGGLQDIGNPSVCLLAGHLMPSEAYRTLFQ